MPENNTLPNSLEAEQSLLGCMLIDNEILPETLETLDEADFYQQSHKYILECMKEVYTERKPVDLVTLSDKLEHKQYLDKCGGIEYVSELTNTVPTAANYRHYYDIVKRDSTNRRLIRAAGEIQKNCMTVDDSHANIQDAEKLIYDISQTYDTSTMKDIRTSGGVEQVIRKFEAIHDNPDALRGVETGFIQLDRLTNGLQKGDLIVLAARPGCGKTSLSMNIVENALLGEKKCVCVVFSLEMPQEQIIQRLLCSNAQVSMSRALAGKLNAADWKKLAPAQKRIQESRLFIDDSSRVTPAEILSKCRRIKAKEGALDLVLVDYIQLMSLNGSGRNSETRAEEVGKITRELKIMAKELDVPLIALSQLRRLEQAKEPQLSDLRESGAIEQDADIVMFINRPDLNLTEAKLNDAIKSGSVVKGQADLIVAKHRNGELDTIKLQFIGEQTRFISALTADEDEYAAAKFNKPPAKKELPDYGGNENPPF